MAVEMNLNLNLNDQSNGGIYLCELPELCLANTISLTSPRDACRLSLVDSTFRSAAQSDDVWERFLPPDYRDILGRSADGIELLLSSMSKKQLYLHLCENPILIDDGTKSFSLEKSSGKKCFMLAASDVKIVWGDTPRYWEWISLNESRLPKVAELLDVCWLEICGKIRTSMLSPDTSYAAYLVFTTTPEIYGFEDQLAEASVGISGQGRQKRAVLLDPDGAQNLEEQMRPRRRGDGWMEVELGEIFAIGERDVELEMCLMEIRGRNWKRGLIVQGIEVRPKEGE